MAAVIRRFVYCSAIASIPLLTVCCFSTLVIHSGNREEFSTSFLDAFGVFVPYVALLIGAFGLLGVIMTETGRSRYIAVLAALALLLWTQSNLLVWDYGVFDGRDINWLEGAWRGVLDSSLWIIVMLAAILLHSRLRKVLIFAAVGTLSVQIISVAMTHSGSRAALISSQNFASDIEGKAAIKRFSRNQNVVHIVMDGFQADIFQDIVNDPSNDSVKSQLQGFTFFSNHLGAYPYTQLTIPALLSGKLYRNQVPIDDFVSDTLLGDTILNTAYNSGYEIDIAAPVALKNIYSLGVHTNAYGIGASGHVTPADYIEVDSAKLIDLALFRSVPHFAKALIHRDELWVFQAKVQSAAYLQMRYFSDLAFLAELADDMTADRETPVYKMIHVMLSHKPTLGNEECEFDGRRTTNRKNVTIQSRCGLKGVLSVLDRMRKLAIYNDSLIVLMADHGAWVPVEDLAQSREVNAMSVAMAIPMLAIKPPQAQHGYQESNAPTSIIDLPTTIAGLLGLNAEFKGIPAFSNQAQLNRRRYHLAYGFGPNPDAKGFLFPMQEYLVEGNAHDADSWRKGRRYLPNGVVE